MVPALYLLICLIWGSTWLAIKVGLVGVPPFLSAGIRFMLSALLVGLVLAVRRHRLQMTRDEKVCVLSAGLLVFWIDYAAVYWAEMHISSGLTAVLFSTMPLMTSVLSAYWTRTETLSRRKVAGILVGMFGTILLFWPHERLGFYQVLGMCAALAASFCAAVNLVMMKKYGRDADPFIVNFFAMGLGAACLVATSVAFETWSAVAWTRSNVLSIAYLSVFGSVIAFSAYYYLIKRMDATIVSLSTLIIPIVALALGHVFLDEVVTRRALAGIATIMAGVAFALVPSIRRLPPGQGQVRNRPTPPRAAAARRWSRAASRRHALGE